MLSPGGRPPDRSRERSWPIPTGSALLELTHTNPAEAFQRYAAYYLSTDGQVYWSDTQQLGFYPDDYHRALDAKLGSPTSTEIIGELYVPRPQIGPFLQEMGDALRAQSVRVIYGTVRLIEKDDDSFLPWARERYACVVVNLHTTHTPEGIERSAAGVSPTHRSRLEARGELLSHVPQVRDEGAGCGLLSTLRRVSGREGGAGSSSALSERLVEALPNAVRMKR